MFKKYTKKSTSQKTFFNNSKRGSKILKKSVLEKVWGDLEKVFLESFLVFDKNNFHSINSITSINCNGASNVLLIRVGFIKIIVFCIKYINLIRISI